MGLKGGGVSELAEFEFVGHPADPTNLTYGVMEGVKSKYYINTPIDSFDFTVKTYEYQIVDPQYYDVTFKKDGVTVHDLSESGTYTVNVTGKNGYSGSHYATFVVGPAAVKSIKDLKSQCNTDMPYCWGEEMRTHKIYYSLLPEDNNRRNPLHQEMSSRYRPHFCHKSSMS